MPRILAVQSHVVRGHVGNCAATLPLQLLGCDVDPLNTVQVSNHSGYPVIKGHRHARDFFADVFAALRDNGHDADYQLILTGYMGLPEGVPAVADGIRSILERNSSTLYVLDPVLGDNGRLYLPREMIDVYKTHFFPLTSVMTPNQFEAELLAAAEDAESASGSPIVDTASAVHTARRLAARSAASLVIVTTLDTPDVADTDTLALLVYTPGTTAVPERAWTVRYPRLTAHFTGTGDLFSALLSGTLAARGVHCAGPGAPLLEPAGTVFDAATAVSRCVWAMQQVLHRTQAEAEAAITPADGRAALLRKRELRLVQSRADIARTLEVTPAEVAASGVLVASIAI
ncbi:Ribokinase-like protein [Blastocladiella britannica]|nr:Ribokinase-like protein [Blastocladiella britannica]